MGTHNVKTAFGSHQYWSPRITLNQPTKLTYSSNEMSRTFLYFAFGSNMLQKRIHYKNPTAVFKCIGKLKDYRLDFALFSKRWQGAAATIVPHSGSEVWGVIWELDMCNLETLDRQEGVDDNVYFRKSVNVETEAGDDLKCEVYQQCDLPKDYCEPKKLPIDRQPSYLYINTIITGAEDHRIPRDYIDFLKSFSHNDNDTSPDPNLSLICK